MRVMKSITIPLFSEEENKHNIVFKLEVIQKSQRQAMPFNLETFSLSLPLPPQTTTIIKETPQSKNQLRPPHPRNPKLWASVAFCPVLFFPLFFTQMDCFQLGQSSFHMSFEIISLDLYRTAVVQSISRSLP